MPPAFVPEGHLIVAQRFSVGVIAEGPRVPKGRLKVQRSISTVPSGRNRMEYANPMLKHWAIIGSPSGAPLPRRPPHRRFRIRDFSGSAGGRVWPNLAHPAGAFDRWVGIDSFAFRIFFFRRRLFLTVFNK